MYELTDSRKIKAFVWQMHWQCLYSLQILWRLALTALSMLGTKTTSAFSFFLLLSGHFLLKTGQLSQYHPARQCYFSLTDQSEWRMGGTHDINTVSNNGGETAPGWHWHTHNDLWSNIEGIPWSIFGIDTISFHHFRLKQKFIMKQYGSARRCFLLPSNNRLLRKLFGMCSENEVLRMHLGDTGPNHSTLITRHCFRIRTIQVCGNKVYLTS